jgi:hypothetical protein
MHAISLDDEPVKKAKDNSYERSVETLVCLSLSKKRFPERAGKYSLDEYIQQFINPDFMLKGDQAYQDIIYPKLLVEGWEPFCSVSSASLNHSKVNFRRKRRHK